MTIRAAVILGVLACAPADRPRDTTPAAPARSEPVARDRSAPAREGAAARVDGSASTKTSKSTVSAASSATSSPVHTVSTVTLERQACYGTCPVYRVQIDSTGHVAFEGRAHVRHQGEASAQMSDESFSVIEAAVLKSGLESLSSDYTRGNPACGSHATDMPSVVLSVTVAGRTRSIRHDYGCSGAPRALRGLYRLIDSVANTGRWTGQS